MERLPDPVMQTAEREIDGWNEQLLDMSHSNRLLFFKTIKASTIGDYSPFSARKTFRRTWWNLVIGDAKSSHTTMSMKLFDKKAGDHEGI
jgi:hypothetical protein